MPMSCYSSGKTFKMQSTTIELPSISYKFQYFARTTVDDFLRIFPSETLCRKQLNSVLVFCNYLAISMAPEKTSSPSPTGALSGNELNTILMEA